MLVGKWSAHVVRSFLRFGDPDDADYVEPLSLELIPTVTELVIKKLEDEEDVVKELKAKQSAAAFEFAESYKEMAEDDQVGWEVWIVGSSGVSKEEDVSKNDSSPAIFLTIEIVVATLTFPQCYFRHTPSKKKKRW